MKNGSALSVAALVLLGALSVSSANSECVCNEQAQLEVQSISSTSPQHNTVKVFIQIVLQSSEQCICCPNVKLGYRYCAWSKGEQVPTDSSNTTLQWSTWIDGYRLCIEESLTISIANLSSSQYYKFQVAPLSTKLGPISTLMYFGSQEIPVIQRIDSRTVQVNDSLSIECEASGSPFPEVSWTSPCFHPLKQVGNALVFEHIQLHQACTYTCLADNWQLNNGNLEHIFVTRDVNIQVIVPVESTVDPMPSVLSTAEVTSTLTNRVLFSEQSVTATASPQVSGAPPTEEIVENVLLPAVTVLVITMLCMVCWIISVAFYCKYKSTRSMTVPNNYHCSPLSVQPCHFPEVNNYYYYNTYIGEYSNRIRQIPKGNLQVLGIIGEGQFATVCCAWAKDIPHAGQQTMVAVKKLKPDIGLTGEVLKTLCHEAKLMCRLDHDHIVKFYGMHVSQDPSVPTMLIYEYMEEGDLRAFLLRKAEVKLASGTAQRQRSLSTSSGYECQHAGLSTVQLLDICLQVAQGMQYLTEKLQLHRDLAARNCLVGKNLLVKISDFGMGQCLYGKDYYRMNRQGYVPVKWMSPEALLYGIFSQYSDVWSFGVLMWEVFTFGQEPYTGKSCEEVVLLMQELNTKHGKSVCMSLSQPSMCPGTVYSIMRHCWSIQRERRPSFKSLVDELNNWLINKQWSAADIETTV